MQVIPRLKHLRNLRNSEAFPAIQLTSFHSTPVCDEKWKKKWNSDFNRGQHQQPSKNYIRYMTRQKRADAKRALKTMLFNGGPFGSAPQHDSQPRRRKDKKTSCDSELEDDTDSFTRTGRSKARRSQRVKSKQRRGYVTEDDEHQETVFQAKFGNRWYTWSFSAFHSSSFRNFTSGFDWKGNAYNRNNRHKWWEAASDIDSDNEAGQVGSHSDRAILGLPLYGPLKVEDVKSAFRLSALKWHPDKHQGPSQGQAEEKFKLCVNAYKALCTALSAA